MTDSSWIGQTLHGRYQIEDRLGQGGMSAVYRAFDNARALVRSGGSAAVPKHLRNAPTDLAKSQGHGDGYRYDHDETGAFSAGQRYFPDEVGEQILYQPVARGMEIKIAEKLEQLRAQVANERDA